jgi:tripartite-type tricarboxylate transporter receptor subunit TctC
MNRRGFQLGLASAAWASWAGSSRADSPWPDRPIRLVLSQPVGSGPDNVARVLGAALAESLGQSFIIDNRPGGQNIIGAQVVSRAAPDGYTLYFATTAALVTNSYLFKSLPYDPLKDFAPVAFVANSPFAILVNGDSQIRSIDELLARSRAEPGKVSVANEGPRTFGGMIAKLMNARAGAGANLVSYSSVATAMQDVMGGHADVLVADVASTAELARKGHLRMLAVTSPQPIAGWDQVPALARTLPGFDMVGWLGIVAPAQTPPAAIARLNAEVNKLLVNPSMAEKILSIGPIVAPASTPQQFDAFLHSEHQRLGQVASEIGLLPE